MDHKEAIVQAATALMEEKENHLDEITVREICKRAGVGLGMVNYHFGSKENLVGLCVERKINAVIGQFRKMQEETDDLAPLEKLELLGNMTLNFLFGHSSISKISVLADMQNPGIGDNTHRTYQAYLPLVAACRPDWEEETVRRKTFCLITIMQQAFLRQGVVSQMLGIDLGTEAGRRAFHTQILHDILEVSQ